MINSIKLIEFSSSANCYYSLRQSKESFLPVNYEFKKGNVYGFISDFGCGSWGLATCLGGRGDSYYRGNILLNDKEILSNHLEQYACFISEKVFIGVNSKQNLLTPRECIKKALLLSNQPYTVNEIQKMFCISEARFDRSIDYVSGEIWFISIAVNFALGKEIFCYPWLNMIDIERFKMAYEHKIIDILKNTGKIIIIPSSQKKVLQKYCNHIIIFDNKKNGIHYH